MSEKMRIPENSLMLVFVALAALSMLILISGCKKEPAAQSVPPTQQAHDQQAHASHEQATTEQPPVQTAALEQKTCPIMEGNPVNRNIFVEYEGKKVYFCCAGCPEKFLENPEQYVAKLPQFQQQQ